MVSEIKGPGSQTIQSLNTGPQKAAPAAPAADGKAPVSGEVVTVTDLGQRLQKLSDSVADLPVVDQQRVNEFREALASGKYPIDDRQIADKLTALEGLLTRAERD